LGPTFKKIHEDSGWGSFQKRGGGEGKDRRSGDSAFHRFQKKGTKKENCLEKGKKSCLSAKKVSQLESSENGGQDDEGRSRAKELNKARQHNLYG